MTVKLSSGIFRFIVFRGEKKIKNSTMVSVAFCVLESVVLLKGTNLNAIYFVRYKAIHKCFGA
jgi:hypothetical protein